VVDGKIIHIPSNAIIFRSSGTDERSTSLSLYSSMETKADEESIDGFTSSINKLGESVGVTLSQFDKFDMSQAVSVNKIIEGQAEEDVPRLVEIAVVPRSVVGWGLKELIQSKEGGTTDEKFPTDSWRRQAEKEGAADG